jgi:hypothetical protein
MIRPWVAAAIAASLIAFAASYAVAQPDGGRAPRAAEHLHRLSLRPSSPPQSWKEARVPGSPAAFAYPAGWHRISGDPGTASAALKVKGRIAGYLNATPQGGEETLANWLSFRPAHNREEGDTRVMPISGALSLRLRGGHASCLVDAYRSSSGARFRELACIVAGRTATTVVVGSAVPSRWQQLAPVLRRAVSSFTT